MAQIFKFRKSATDTSLVDSSGWYLLDPGWIPKIGEATEGRVPPPVEEVLQIESNYASQDDLGDGLIAFNKLRRDAARYIKDTLENTPVWLHDQLNSENSERRALVRRISIEQLTEQHGVRSEGSMIDAKPHFELAVERGACWENPSVTNATSTSLSGAADSHAYYPMPTGSVDGDRPARIYQWEYRSNTTGADLDRMWIGIRSADKHGTVSNFIKIWECEDSDATLGTDAARADDNTASPGDNGGDDNKVTITPGTATWAKRLTIALSDVTSDYSDNFGRFIWLLRHKLSSGTWEVQLRFGYNSQDDDDRIKGPIKELSNTSWDYINLGQATIPLRPRPQVVLKPTAADGSWEIQIWARRTSGSGTLDLDCLCPIPIDEGYLIAWDIGGTTKTDDFSITIGPEDVIGCVTYTDSDSVITSVPYEHNYFYLPPGTGQLIVAFARDGSSVITDEIYFARGSFYERWLTLRGSE